MKTSNFKQSLVGVLSCWLLGSALAFPPAPFYQIYGVVRNEQGTPLGDQTGRVILSGVYSAFGIATLSNGAVTGVTILNGGGGFTSSPVVTFSAPAGSDGSGASGVAVLTDGVVTDVTVTNGGSGYTGEVTVGITGGGALPVEIVTSMTDTTLGIGINYALSVPMDSATSSQLFEVSAMRPMLPFTIRVVIDGVNYVPMQIVGATTPYWTQIVNQQNNPSASVQGGHWAVGLPAGKLRLDLWLGEDANGDGLPDAWQWNVVNSDPSGRLSDFTQVLPGDDLSGNGMTNMDKFIAGVYAMEVRDGLHFQVDSITDGIAKLHFQAISGRTYHIASSSDLVTWQEVEPFSESDDAADLRTHYLAETSKVLNIYVPLTELKQKYFKLYVE